MHRWKRVNHQSSHLLATTQENGLLFKSLLPKMSFMGNTMLRLEEYLIFCQPPENVDEEDNHPHQKPRYTKTMNIKILPS